jgi:TatD family-associated radical SAM protein
MFCIRNYDAGVFGFDLSLDRDPTAEELTGAIRRTWKPVFVESAIVGLGEPLLNLEGTLASVRQVKSLADVPVRINTNGEALLIYPRRDVPRDLAEAGMDHVQVSINAPDSRTYVKLCRPSFGEKTYASMIKFAERCLKYMSVELSVVRVPGVDIEACRHIADRIGADFKVREYRGPAELLDAISRLLVG